MAFKIEKWGVRTLAVEYADSVCRMAEALPSEERSGLWSQVPRAANGIALDIAEGAGQDDAEQGRFMGAAPRPLVETDACLRIIRRRGVADVGELRTTYRHAEKLFAKLQASRSLLRGGRIREGPETYDPSPPS